MSAGRAHTEIDSLEPRALTRRPLERVIVGTPPSEAAALRVVSGVEFLCGYSPLHGLYPPEMLDILQSAAVSSWDGTVYRHMFASQAITEPMRFGFEGARDVKRRFLTFWNVYGLFVTYANLDRPALLGPDSVPTHSAPLDQWLLSRLQATIAEVREAFDTYQVRRAVASDALFSIASGGAGTIATAGCSRRTG